MATDGRNTDPGRGSLTPEERDALKRRASELGKRLDEVHARKAGPAVNARGRGTALGEAFKIVGELVVGVVVGGGIGWALDRTIGTAPWLMVLFLIFGFAAGLSNVVRTARKMQAASEPLQRNAPAVVDDDEDEGGRTEATGKAPRRGS